MMRLLPKLRVIGSVALAGALAACGSSALYGVPGASPAGPSPAPAKPYNVSRLLDPATGKFLGVQAPGAPDALGPVQTFAASAGVHPNLIGEYMAWNKPMDTQAAENAWSYGALYYMVWEPYSTSVASIAAGHSDAYISSVARQVRALNQPVAISFGHEFNGNWYPWGTTGTTSDDFVTAWRLIHRLFIKADARNVIWIWNPNVIDANPQLDLADYYPGDAYVTWVGITGYFSTTGPDTFDGLYGPTMQEIRGFTSKPFLIAETSVETGPDEVTAAQALVSGVKESPDVLGFIWFNYDKLGVDWQLQTRPSVQSAIAGELVGVPLLSVRRP
jgi:mannan endo-1,4-beta-mannosidase